LLFGRYEISGIGFVFSNRTSRQFIQIRSDSVDKQHEAISLMDLVCDLLNESPTTPSKISIKKTWHRGFYIIVFNSCVI
jgi:hypothetical protein